MKGKYLTMMKMDQVDRRVLGTVRSCIQKVLPLTTALQCSITDRHQCKCLTSCSY